MLGHYSLHSILGRLLNPNSIMIWYKPNMLRVFRLLGFPLPQFRADSVHEYGQSLFWENKIRFACQRLMPPPALDAMFTKELQQFDLSGFVALPANAGHHLAAFVFGEDVGHRIESA